MTKSGTLEQLCASYLDFFCQDIQDRSVGCEGNRKATDLFEKELSSLGWYTERSELDVIDWEEDSATLQVEHEGFTVLVSPYSLGCSVNAPLVAATCIEELEQQDITGKVLLLHGEIATEQLMPKNFVFYNPEEHQKIIALLENKKPVAIITATTKNSVVAGGVYPFPLIEDGDFDIPSVYMTEEEGNRLLPYVSQQVTLNSISKRIPSKAYNVIARRGGNSKERITITAHIDAKKGVPGAIDNATGVITLLLLGDLLKDYTGSKMIEIVALNGEDHYAVPGQMNYISNNQDHFSDIMLNVNIDGVGYREGKSALSFFNVPEEIKAKADELIAEKPGLVEGVPWFQGDHSMFVQNGCPAIAVTSQWLLENMSSQTITHTSKDNPEIIDCKKVVEAAQALESLLQD